jgi:hypothetical protein
MSRAGFRIAAARPLLQRFDAPLQAVEIGEHQLGLDGLDVFDRRDPALDVNDVAAGKAAHDVDDGIDFADVGEELVAQTFAARCAAHQPGDVDEGEPGRHHGGGFGECGDRREPRIGHRHLAQVGLDGAERIILRLRGGGLGQRVEQGGLADVRQPDDPTAESHVRAVRRPHPPARRDAWARRTPSPPSPGGPCSGSSRRRPGRAARRCPRSPCTRSPPTRARSWRTG